MDEGIKGRVIFILSILSVIFILLWLGAVKELSRQKRFVTEKAALTMELEEKIARLEKDKASLAEELKKAQAQLSEEKALHEATLKSLSREQVAEQALKVELERVTRLNEVLEKKSPAASGQ